MIYERLKMLASKVKCPKCGKLVMAGMGLGRIGKHDCEPNVSESNHYYGTDYQPQTNMASIIENAYEMLTDDKPYSMQDLGSLDYTPSDSSTDIGGGGDFGGGGSSGDW
jgi:uncharacterized membrane protein YgcG